MPDILEEIVAQRRHDIESARHHVNLADLAAKIARDYPAEPLNLYEVISSCPFCVAAEFKRASPSKGDIVPEGTLIDDKIPAYLKGGASILSVLTEPKWFKGHLEDMQRARQLAEAFAVEHPAQQRAVVLRKDFIDDEYQIVEARAYGADTLLLIVASLPEGAVLRKLVDCARHYGMEPLVEVNSVAEVDIALEAGSKVLGINNRNLRTFVVDMDTTQRVVEHVAAMPVHARPYLISLSGVRDPADLRALVDRNRGSGSLKGALIGEALMRSEDPAADVRAYKDAFISPDERPDVPTLVKLCGISQPADAVAAARAGADMVGMIFVRGSRRFVTCSEASTVCAAVRKYREQDPRPLLSKLCPGRLSPSISLSTACSAYVNRLTTLQSAIQRARPLCVGVFMDQPAEEVVELAGLSGIDVVQLHGHEEPSHFEHMEFPIIKVVHVPAAVGRLPDTTIAEILSTLERWSGIAVAILLDTTAKGSSGGTGVTFNHRELSCQISEVLQPAGAALLPVLVAGGLGAANVAGCVADLSSAVLQVAGVDTASGIEDIPTDPRRKSEAMMMAFVSAAKAKVA